MSEVPLKAPISDSRFMCNALHGTCERERQQVMIPWGARGRQVSGWMRENSSRSTRWSTTFSSTVNLPHATNLRAVCGANLVTWRSNFEPRKPLKSTVWCGEPMLYCNPKGRRALLRIPSTAGRSVCLWWALSKPKGPVHGEPSPTKSHSA